MEVINTQEKYFSWAAKKYEELPIYEWLAAKNITPVKYHEQRDSSIGSYDVVDIAQAIADNLNDSLPEIRCIQQPLGNRTIRMLLYEIVVCFEYTNHSSPRIINCNKVIGGSDGKYKDLCKNRSNAYYFKISEKDSKETWTLGLLRGLPRPRSGSDASMDSRAGRMLIDRRRVPPSRRNHWRNFH